MIDNKTDTELISLYIEDGDNEAGEILWIRHRAIIYAAVRQYFGSYKRGVEGLDIEDMRQLAAEHFFRELIIAWKPEQGKLHSFTSVAMRNFCFYHLKRLGRHKRTWQLEADSLNELIKTGEGMMDYADVLKDESLPNPADVATHNELKSILESSIDKLSRKHKEVYYAMLLETGVFSAENPYLSKFTIHYIQKWRDEVIQALKEALENSEVRKNVREVLDSY